MTVKARPHLAKKRLDVLLVERGLIESRQKAQAIILAGEVRVNGQRAEARRFRLMRRSRLPERDRRSRAGPGTSWMEPSRILA